MSRPHCGVKGRPGFDGDNSRHKRFALFSSKWESHEITFRVLSYPDKQGLTRMAVDEVVEQAFATWAPETNLTFRQVSECADINIAFIEANKTHIENFRNRTIFGYAYTPSKGRVFQCGLGLVH